MAITRKGQVIRMTAAADTITERLIIQGIHILGANLVVTDGEGSTILTRGAGTASGNVTFPCKLSVNGISFTGTGEITVFLA